MKCMGCGVEKDLNVLEAYPYEELHPDPGTPLLVVECFDLGMLPYKAVVVCYECFHKLDVDMWIDQKVWKSINPIVPYKDLPDLVKDPELKWKPETYNQ